MSNWLSVFGRDYSAQDPCIENLYGVCLDGLDDFLVNTGGTMQPTSIVSKQWVSVWVKDMDTTAINSGEFIFTQSVSGNNNADFWRIAYNTNNSGGSPLNIMTIEWRASGSGNRILKQYRLHDHTAITGSTGLTDFWLDGNSNINTTPDGYVHLLAIWDVPALGQNMNTGDVQLYWNGQLMNSPYIDSKAGTSQTSIFSNTNLYLGTNGSNTTGFWKGQMDEVFITNQTNGLIFMSDKGLSTNQDVANFLYNTGCPGDIGSDGRWNFNWWRFENTWNADSGSNAWSPVNGAIIGSYPNGCFFAPAAISCTTNTLRPPFWHTTNPFPISGSDSISVENYLKTDFATATGTWSTTSINGSMAWLVIGKDCNGTPTSSMQTYIGDDYWIIMKTNDGDNNAQSLPSVAGGTSNPNVLYLEEKDASTGALTGNIIEFQCIIDAVSINSGVDFIFKARCTDTDFTNNNTCDGYTTGPALPKDSSGNTTGEYCVTWSSTTAIQTVSVENKYTTDFNY